MNNKISFPLRPLPLSLPSAKMLKLFNSSLRPFSSSISLDQNQKHLLKVLNKLSPRLSTYQQDRYTQSKKPRIPKGMYVYGSVGIGKTLIMDSWYATLPDIKKRRVHFHEFMLGIHTDIHKEKTERGVSGSEAIKSVAKKVRERI